MPEQNGRHFAEDIFSCIPLLFYSISPKFVSMDPIIPIGYTSALFRVMAWYRTAGKSLLEAMIAQIHDAIGHQWVNSLWPGRCEYDSKNVIFNLVLLTGIFKSSYDSVRRWMPHDLTDDKSTLVQVMAWYRQATSHYLNQCWPRSPTPYGVTIGPNELRY